MEINLTSAELAPWDQLPREPEHLYERFVEFLEYEGTLREFCKLSDVNTNLAMRWRWATRKRATYGVPLDAIAWAGSVDDCLRDAWAETLSWAYQSIVEARARGDKLPPSLALQALKTGGDVLRLLEGKPQARLAVDIGKLTDAQLSALDTLDLLGPGEGDS